MLRLPVTYLLELVSQRAEVALELAVFRAGSLQLACRFGVVGLSRGLYAVGTLPRRLGVRHQGFSLLAGAKSPTAATTSPATRRRPRPHTSSKAARRRSSKPRCVPLRTDPASDVSAPSRRRTVDSSCRLRSMPRLQSVRSRERSAAEAPVRFRSISLIRLREFSARAEARNTAALAVLSAPPTSLSEPDAASPPPWAADAVLVRGSGPDIGRLHAEGRALWSVLFALQGRIAGKMQVLLRTVARGAAATLHAAAKRLRLILDKDGAWWPFKSSGTARQLVFERDKRPPQLHRPAER